MSTYSFQGYFVKCVGLTLLLLFELTIEENHRLRSQNVTLKRGQHSKYTPMVFTEQGVAMLSSVLKSERAIQVNIQIMRAFTNMRQFLSDNAELRKGIENLKADTDGKFRIVFETLDQLLSLEDNSEKKIGYIKEELSDYGKEQTMVDQSSDRKV